MLWRPQRPQRPIAELDARSGDARSTTRACAGHQHELQFETDREKDPDLLAHGHRVIRVTYERLNERPAKEAARFERLLA